MFETAELGRTVAKDEYHAAVPVLRSGLLEVQERLRSASFPVILVFGGVDKGGKIETINLLNEWLDPRWLMTRAYGPPSDEMAERPEYWRYWRDLPPKGRIGMFLRCWYSRPILDRVHGQTSEPEFDEALDRIIAFERCLANDNALILKFWMHLDKKAQKERLTQLESNSLTRWRVTQTDWDHWQLYESFIAAAERVLRRTSTGRAAWQIVEGQDKRYRSLTVGKAILQAITAHLQGSEMQRKILAELKAKVEPPLQTETISEENQASAVAAANIVRLPHLTVLSRLDMSLATPAKAYEKSLEGYQGKLNRVFRKAKDLGISSILVFEGWDAAGKGGAIRRIVSALDARDYQVIPIAAPTDEERAQHYLWRFWRHLSRAGRMTIFDRSWYGRVLVERVEHFAEEAEWKRAYAEINDFEDQLANHGIVLCKFWFHITKEEQLARFKAREDIAYKRFKLTAEDWRNREKWDDYEIAVDDMIEHTSTRLCPWTLVEANDKRFARIKVLQTICERLSDGVDRNGDKGKAPRPNKLKRTG